MALEDIERLKEKIEKDPNSKLFVPLAEEYKKAGMYDEAINVLIKGIEKQPNYLSARVSLGKIYIEKGMYKEAKEEFEKVTEVIPDNLYAHKKLAEINKEIGDKEKTIYELKKVLEINPADEWASAMLVSMQTGMYDQRVIEVEKEPERKEEIETGEEEVKGKIEELETQVKEGNILKEEIAEEVGEEVAGIVTGIEEIKEEDYEVTAEEIEEKEEAQVDISEELEVKGFEEIEEETGKGIGKEEDLWEELAEEIDLRGEKKAEEDEVEEESFSFDDIFKKQDTEEAVAIEEMPESVQMAGEEIAVTESPEVDIYNSLKGADDLILQERYMDAMNVYKALLSEEPENRHVLQRIEELKALLKLLGKDKEALIHRLEDFLKGIKKRRDEFYRGT